MTPICRARLMTGALGFTLLASHHAVSPQWWSTFPEAPSFVSLTIGFDADTAVFRLGEAIPIRLTFVSSSPGFQVVASGPNPLGPAFLARYVVEPGDRDMHPMSHLDRSGVWGEAGSIGGRIWELSDEGPYSAVEFLNSQARFVRPGWYRVTAVSDAVRHGTAHPYYVRSNFLDFEVVEPEVGWAALEMRRWMETADGADDPSVLREAVARLAWLDTGAVAPYLARRWAADATGALDRLFHWLAAPVYRRAAFEAIEQSLAAGLAKPTDARLWELAFLRLAIERDFDTAEPGVAERHRRQRRHRELLDEYRRRYQLPSQ